MHNLLVLEKVEGSGDGGREKRTKVAQLVRSDEMRTPGTSAMYAGNGGRLQMQLAAQEGGEALLDEPTVVSTCLIMLKKEVDRRRSS